MFAGSDAPEVKKCNLVQVELVREHAGNHRPSRHRHAADAVVLSDGSLKTSAEGRVRYHSARGDVNRVEIVGALAQILDVWAQVFRLA